VADYQPHQVNPKAWQDPSADRFSVNAGYSLQVGAQGPTDVVALARERDVVGVLEDVGRHDQYGRAAVRG
jgi:hypothetical protein